MAYVDPATFVAGDPLAAADLNVIGADVRYLKAIADGVNMSGTRITRGTNQSISNTTATSISFTAETFDYGGWWSSGTNVVVPAGAIPTGFTTIMIQIVGRIRWATSGTGNRRIDALVNGSSTGGVTQGGIAGDPTDQITVTFTEVAAGDVITLEAYQSSGGALNVSTAYFHVIRHAPGA